MRPFANGSSLAETSSTELEEEGPVETIYDGPGLAGGTVRNVRCSRTRRAFAIEIEGGPVVLVSRNGEEIARVAPGRSIPTELDLEALFGPAFILGLALKGTFCLHASCIRFGGRVAAVMGPSGSGKSTLARLAAALPGWDRIADDVLPVVATPEGVFALPRFPQQKLSPAEQWGAEASPALRLDAVYDIGESVLSEAGATGGPFRPLDVREAMLRLVGRTVAARLFDGSLTGRNLEFCEEILRRIPVRGLAYERSLDRMPALFAALEEDLGSLSRA